MPRRIGSALNGEEAVLELSHLGLMHVAAFTRVVDAGSFTAAARQLGMSKASVSKYVTALEAQLGISLLSRTTRSLRLTDEGARFYGHCRTILTEVATAESEIGESAGRARGRLRVTAPTFMGGQALAAALCEFLDSHPDLRIELVLRDDDAVPFDDGSDLAIRILRAPVFTNRASRLGPVAQIVCAAPRYLERFGAPAAPRDLPRHHCLGHAHLFGAEAWRLDGPRGLDPIEIRPRFRASSFEALRNGVLSGLGLALLPRFLVEEDLRRGRLIDPLPDYQDGSCAAYVVYPEDRPATPKMRAFVAFLETCCRLGHVWACRGERAPVSAPAADLNLL